MSQNRNYLTKILEHVDREEILSKLILGISEADIHEWLKAKYTNASESKFVLPERTLKIFKDNYLDLYTYIKDDILKTKEMLASPDKEIELAVKNNKSYKEKMLELADKEIDIKTMIAGMISAIETRAAQVFDSIQDDPRNMRTDRVLIEWFELLGNTLEKYHKIVNNVPDQVIQHNVTIQAMDQHVNVIIEAIRETLLQFDVQTSLYFMEIFNEKISKLRAPTINKELASPEVRLAEAKILNENINNKLSEIANA